MREAVDLLKGGRVFVTGAASGAGRVIAQMFADRGATVLACDIDQGAVDELARSNPNIIARQADASNANQLDALFAEMEADGAGVDVLVNNVGIAGPTAPVEEISSEDWEQSLRVNLSSHFFAIRRAVPGMRARKKGLIVNISSGSAKTGLPLRLPYVVTKGAVLSMTMNLARELGPDGIRVNAILPGAISGDRIQRVIDAKSSALGMAPEEYERTMLRYVSMRTMVDPADIAAMAIFLASAEGARISGQMIGVDGNVEYEE